MTPGDIANLIAALSGSAAAVIAVITIRVSARQRADERLVGYAVRSLERAYEALMGRTPATRAVQADRLAWLTSARLIEQYKDAKARIKNEVARHECEGHEEHWRHQFYLALQPLQNTSQEYYSIGHGSGGPIQPVSAIIVHAFAIWPDGKDDPLSKYETEEQAIKALNVHLLWSTLRRHLKLA